MLSAVHTWNGGGTGIALGSATAPYGAHQNRLLGCYLDYNTLDVYDPSAVIVESTFCVPIWSSNPGLADSFGAEIGDSRCVRAPRRDRCAPPPSG